MAHILIIDDDDNLRAVLRRVLESEGHVVSAACDGREALRVFGSSVDLVITDMLMPEMDGLETIGALKKRVAGLPIIGMSGGGQIRPEEYLNVATILGADRTLIKPFSHSALLDAIAELLAEPAPPPNPVARNQ